MSIYFKYLYIPRASMAQKLEDMLQQRVQENEQDAVMEEEEDVDDQPDTHYDYNNSANHAAVARERDNYTLPSSEYTVSTHPLLMSDKEYSSYNSADTTTKKKVLISATSNHQSSSSNWPVC